MGMRTLRRREGERSLGVDREVQRQDAILLRRRRIARRRQGLDRGRGIDRRRLGHVRRREIVGNLR